MKMSRPGGTGLIAIMNGMSSMSHLLISAASVPGNALLGHFTDRMPINIAVFASSVAAAASCLFFWGFGTHEAVLVVFAILYGLFGLSFTALWVRIIGVIARMSVIAPKTWLTSDRGRSDCSPDHLSDIRFLERCWEYHLWTDFRRFTKA